MRPHRRCHRRYAGARAFAFHSLPLKIDSRAVQTSAVCAAMLLMGCHKCDKQGDSGSAPSHSHREQTGGPRSARLGRLCGTPMQSPEVANVTARVSGFIVEVPFKEGALVKQGDVLFVMDDRPFKADLDNKIAQVQKDEASTHPGGRAIQALHRPPEKQDHRAAGLRHEQSPARPNGRPTGGRQSRGRNVPLESRMVAGCRPPRGPREPHERDRRQPGHRRRRAGDFADDDRFRGPDVFLDRGPREHVFAVPEDGRARKSRGGAARKNSLLRGLGIRDQFPPRGCHRFHRQRRRPEYRHHPGCAG